MNDDLITELRADRRGATLVVNGEATLWISREILLERELTQGQELNYEELKKWLLPRQYPEALKAAVALLAVRTRSAKEVRRRLEQKRYLDETVEMVLYKLEKEGLLDDEAFAREWAEGCARGRMGKRRILDGLRQKSIDADTAQRAVDGLDAEECDEAAVELARKLLRRYAGADDPEAAARKLMAAMLRRGYSHEEAQAALQEALRRAEEE